MSKNINYDLRIAVEQKNLPQIKELLNQGADPLYYFKDIENAKQGDIISPAIQTAAIAGDLEVFKLCFNKIDSKPNVLVPFSGSLLNSACGDYYCNLEIIKILLEAGANLNYQNDDGLSALFYALVYCPPAIIEYLLEQGAKLNLSTAENESCLHLLSSRINVFGDEKPEHDLHAKIVELALESGVDINQEDKIHGSALFSSLNGNSYILFDLLIKHKANQELRNKDGLTLEQKLNENWKIKIYQSFINRVN